MHYHMGSKPGDRRKGDVGIFPFQYDMQSILVELINSSQTRNMEGIYSKQCFHTGKILKGAFSLASAVGAGTASGASVLGPSPGPTLCT